MTPFKEKALSKLSIVIVNYNVSTLLRRCLQTVLASTGDIQYKVIVVDNNSTDDSVAMVQREFPDVPIIAMSAHVQPEEQARFLASGMAGFHNVSDSNESNSLGLLPEAGPFRGSYRFCHYTLE